MGAMKDLIIDIENARREEALRIANSLSNEDLVQIINICAQRLEVFIGRENNHQIGAGVLDACLNGGTVQINLETIELENLSTDPFWKKAFNANQSNTE